MRYSISFPLLAVLVLTSLQSQAVDPSLAERLEKLAPRAAGIAQVEVEEIREIDRRGGCGDLYLDVRWRILRGTGETPAKIYIVKKYGGHFPDLLPPPVLSRASAWGVVTLRSPAGGGRPSGFCPLARAF